MVVCFHFGFTPSFSFCVSTSGVFSDDKQAASTAAAADKHGYWSNGVFASVCLCELLLAADAPTAGCDGYAISVPAVSYGRGRHESPVHKACLSGRAQYELREFASCVFVI
ncbi:hypothetical protein TcG_05334 [Trypanosoma cruzi]|nr:hypothetical protein TcG_05334 [Trypanosoma cruzi]